MREPASRVHARRAPAYVFLAVALLLGLAVVPLPGIDQAAALQQLGRASAWWSHAAAAWPPAFSPLSSGLLGLVLARLALDLILGPEQDLATRRLWTAVIMGLYLGGTFVGGVALALALRRTFSDLLVVQDPFVLAGLVGLSTTAAAAAAWSFASLVRRSGLASGALLLFGVWELVRMGRFLLELGFALLGTDSPEPGLALMPLHLGVLPVALVCLALWRASPGPLPVLLARRLTVRSPLDLLIVPLVVGAIAGTFAADLAGIPPWTPQSPLYDQGLLARTLGSLLVVPAISVWLMQRRAGPGHWGWAVLALGLLLAVGGGLAWTLSVSP